MQRKTILNFICLENRSIPESCLLMSGQGLSFVIWCHQSLFVDSGRKRRGERLQAWGGVNAQVRGSFSCPCLPIMYPRVTLRPCSSSIKAYISELSGVCFGSVYRVMLRFSSIPLCQYLMNKDTHSNTRTMLSSPTSRRRAPCIR